MAGQNVNETKVRVRYAETDQMGIVYYGNYATYLEIGRVEYMREIGFVYKELEKAGIIMPVVHCSIDYKSPAKYDDEILIQTKVKEMPTSKITFEYELYNESSNDLICSATVILVFLNKKTFRPTRAPESLNHLLSKLV